VAVPSLRISTGVGPWLDVMHAPLAHRLASMRSPLRPPRLLYRSPPNVAEIGCCASYSDISAHTARRGGRISTIVLIYPPVLTPCRSPASGRGGQLDVQRCGIAVFQCFTKR
jgi:hypothetical protein